MTAQDFIKPEKIRLLFDLRDSVKQYLPIIDRFVAEGLGFNEHLQKAKEQQEWIDKTINMLQLDDPR